MHLNSRAVVACRISARAGIVICTILGGMGIGGWIFHVEYLKTLQMSDIAMTANAATCLFLAGVSLFALFEFQDNPSIVLFGRVLAVIVGLLGILTLSEHINGWNLGIDQLLFHQAPGAPGTTSPNRMGPFASTSFALLGLSLFLLHAQTKKGFVPSQWSAILAGFIAIVPLIGYAYSANALYSKPGLTAIAYPTAFAIAALAFGILCSNPHRGLMTVICAEGPGGHMARSLLIPSIVVPFLLGWLRGIVQTRHLVGDGTGWALLVLSMAVIFTSLVWLNAGALMAMAQQRERAEEQRDQSSAELKEYFDNTTLGLHRVGPDGMILQANRAILEILGYPEDEYVGQTVGKFFDDRSVIDDILAKLNSGQSVTNCEARLRRNDHSIKHVEIRVDGIWRNGKLLYSRWFTRDITDRKDAERTNKQLAQIVESSQDAVIGKSLEGIITSWNAGAERLYGYSAEEIVGQSITTLLPPDRQDELPDIIKHITGGGQVNHYDTVRLTKDGRRIEVSVTVSPVTDAAGRVIGASAIARDITERREAEEAARKTAAELRLLNETLEKRVAERTEEAESRARQLRGLALDLADTESRERKRLAQLLHDHFQQLVSTAKLKTAMARRSITETRAIETLKQSERLLEEAIEASRTLATELSPPVLNDAGLIPALEWLSRKMEADYGLHVSIQSDRNAEPQSDRVRTLLFECIRELLFNVVKHAKTNGASVTLRMLPEGILNVVVADRGTGFDPNVLNADRVNHESPFGLFSIRERLTFIGGLMNIRSTVGEGTRMELSIPVGIPVPPKPTPIEPIRNAPTDNYPSPATTDRPIRVLVADDHKLFRMGFVQLLAQEPTLDVIGEAADGNQAVQLARQLKPDVLILDVSMPGMNGLQVAAQISRELPQTRIVGLSMHEDSVMAKAMFDAGATAYLNKGASSEEILSVLRSFTTARIPCA